jgi:hypothetical protein
MGMENERVAHWLAVAASIALAATLAGWGWSPGGQGRPAPAAPVAATTFVLPNASAPPASPTPAAATMAFGADASSVAALASQGIPADYGTLWVGAWTLRWGWDAPDAALRALRAANVTPAVQLYYWGDDLTQGCLEQGCNGKSVAGWDALATQLADHLRSALGGQAALVVLETEFNKAGVARYRPLDALLAQKAATLRAVPGVRVALALGNWNPTDWTTWARAAAASDYTGLQALFGATRDAPDALATLANRTLAGARELRRDFGKPVLLDDLALSSYPEPDALAAQAGAVRQLLGCLAPLKAAGVQAILYRGFQDDPTMDLGNYYGLAERHFGLAWADGAGLKPAGIAWRDGVARERAAAVAPGAAAGC